ncbi:hypothetical protein [Propionivibrio sp.]|uniref:hypothetical protein n=1 Tax=Propionivibrio sp. TaxID=2212460 RepID=UPI003BF09565
MLLVSGGSSVGVHDHVRPTLEVLGVEMHFWRVEMRPGQPVASGGQGDPRRTTANRGRAARVERY